jgi:alkylated DNA nucleotide flippase Atl1
MTPYARRVLDVVDLIPAGKVLTYGDVRNWLGESSPRAVGTVLARYGSEVPWHRVVMSTGFPPPGKQAQALALLRSEGVPLLGERVDLRRARWDGCGPDPR